VIGVEADKESLIPLTAAEQNVRLSCKKRKRFFLVNCFYINIKN
jgi:hypothetical protein